MTELELHQPTSDLFGQMEYARAVSVASMLPDNYRNKPADIMLAVGLGSAMGLSPAESLYRISVIKGKPTASAELVAANVRKAGHRLRVLIEPGKATATIVRSDDPEFEFTVVRDAAWAQQMGLSDQPNYKKQGDTMLSWRAITAAARLACPEALYGVAYTSDELGDFGTQRTTVEQTAPASDRMADILKPSGSEAAPDDAPAGHPVEQPPQASEPEPAPVTKAQLTKIGACMSDLGITERAEALGYVAATIGREVASRNELSKSEAMTLIDRLDSDIAASAVDAEVVQ